MSDAMEYGDSGLVAEDDGWFRDAHTGNRVDPDGRVFSPTGEVLWLPELDANDPTV